MAFSLAAPETDPASLSLRRAHIALEATRAELRVLEAARAPCSSGWSTP